MIAKITCETIHGDVGLGADSTEFEYFETFDAMMEWAKASIGDGYHLVLNEGHRAEFGNGENITLLETDSTVAYIDGTRAHQRDTITSELMTLTALPEASVYFSGDNGSLVALSDGNHVDTVSGDGWWQDGEISIGRSNCNAFLQEMRAIHERITEKGRKIEPEPYNRAYLDALDYAYNCVPDEITSQQQYNSTGIDDVTPRQYACGEYTGEI